LPQGASFSAATLIDQNLVPLVAKFFSRGWNPGEQKLVTHLDNTPAQNPKITQTFCEHAPLKRLHLPYSPHIFPSDFYRFGEAKGALIGQPIPDEVGLLDAMIQMLESISSDELQSVFRNWIERVQSVIDADGGYLSE
jgi:hypothetical protein